MVGVREGHPGMKILGLLNVADSAVCWQVDKDSVKPPPAVEETYRGVAAPSRPKVGNAEPVEEMPKVHLPSCLRESRHDCVLVVRSFARRAGHADKAGAAPFGPDAHAAKDNGAPLATVSLTIRKTQAIECCELIRRCYHPKCVWHARVCQACV